MMGLKRQSGFTLAEILIAIAVSIILSAGVVKIYAANKQAFRMADAESRIQENARFATEALGLYWRMAGYREDDVEKSFAVTFSAVTLDGQSYASEQVIAGGDDEVFIRFLGDGFMSDCEDNTVIAAGTDVSIHFSLDGSDLKCGSSLDAGGDQALISNVNSLSFLYGVDVDNDLTADRYDLAANVPDWKNVVGLRMEIVLESEGENTSVNAGDRLQRTYIKTVGMRNRLP